LKLFAKSPPPFRLNISPYPQLPQQGSMNDKTRLEKVQIFADIFGKLLIPVLVVLVPVMWAQHQDKILQQKKEHELEQKYIEIFYNDITSEKSDRRKLAEVILRELKPELQIKLARALALLYPGRGLQLSANLASDTTQSAKIRSSAQDTAFRIAGQFVIVSPLEDESVGRTVSVRGRTPYKNRSHYLVITPEGQGDFLHDIPVSISPDGSFSISATLGSATRGVEEQYTLRVVAAEVKLTRGQIRANKIPLDVFSSNSVTVVKSEWEVNT